jgi:hypothetical protein
MEPRDGLPGCGESTDTGSGAMNSTQRAMYWVRWNWHIQWCRKLIRGQVDDE